MGHDEGIVRGAGGIKLYYRRWRPEADPPRAVLAYIRSPDAHVGLYTALIAQLVPHGYAIYGFTHREHDRSPGQQGYIQEWGESREDVHAFLQMVGEAEPGRPLFLMGNGLGGFIAQTYAVHYPGALTGVIAFDPAMPPEDVPPFRARLVRTLSRLWPRFTASTQLDSLTLSPERIDPAEESDAPARPQREDSAAIEQSDVELGDMSVPLLIFHGPADQPGSQAHHAAAEYGQALGELERWMDRQLHPGGSHESTLL